MEHKNQLIVKYLLFIMFLLCFLFSKAQVTILPGESTNIADRQVFHGDYNQGYNNCNFIKGKGMLSVGFQVQKEGVDTWDEIYIAFQYGGVWYRVCDFFADRSNFFYITGYPNEWYATDHSDGNKTHVFYNVHQPYNYLPANNIYPSQFGRTKVTETFCGSTGTSTWGLSMYLANNGILKRYNGNYLPVGGDINYRNTPADNANYSIQTRPFSNTYQYPVSDPLSSSGDLAVSTGWTGSYWNSISVGNLPGVAMIRRDVSNTSVIINITNLPPEMLEAPSFKVHVYGKSITGNHNRIYETVYNNPNFMTIAPVGLTATKNLCGRVTLNWSNSGANNLPADGNVNLKYVIFRNATYLATVAGTVTTYDDLTAAQDVEYDYSIRHIAFSESGDTYFRSPATSPVKGSVKPSPEEPHSFTASTNKCDGSIQLNWLYSGADPDKFRILFTDSPVNTYTAIPNVSGSNRSYIHTGLTRGKDYYYQAYAINTCSVLSTNFGTTNGISPSVPAVATNITAIANTVSNSIDISWLDNANNETKYELVRTDDAGNTVITELNSNTTTYSDNAVTACRMYTYKLKVFNDCVLNGIISLSSAQISLPPPNLTNTFDATHKLTASKGHYGNRTELSWSSNNVANIDYYKIYRKQLGTTLDSVQIAAPIVGSAFFVDNTADAKIFYRYTIVGIKRCNGSEILTNISSDIGFRNPSGLISGHIEYNGGVDVSGVKVLIESTGIARGKSLHLNTNGLVTIKDNPKLEPGAQIRCEFWIKPVVWNTGNIISKNNSFRVSVSGSTNIFAGVYTGGLFHGVSVPKTDIPLNNWSHFSMVYDGATLKVLINGVTKASTSMLGLIDDNNSNLEIAANNGEFYIDEFRLIGQAQPDSIIAIDANRILNGDETGFKCNLHFDESVGTDAYDVSRVANIFNDNHASFLGNVNWSNDTPTSSQLSYFGITNNLGNYSVSGIQYVGNGANFNITPQYQTHVFSPDDRSVYISDANYVFNNQNFTDISSFPFTGTLFYKGTTCPVPGAGLKVDGLPVIVNGQQAVTDASGTFSISVPIGNHFVSIEKYGHDMESGRYPAVGTHNFQASVSGVSFIDSTTVKLVGRVVGGKVEADKAPGMGRSINNIGKAKIRFVTPLTGSPCYVKTITTNSVTGEYIVRIPPMSYKVDSAFVLTNSVVISKSNLSNTNQVLDLTSVYTTTTDVDTLRDNLGGVLSIDSIKYNKKLDFIYRTQPEINVLTINNEKLHGEDTLYANGVKVPLRPSFSPGNYGWGPFDWPIYLQGKVYGLKIHANEVYTNTDNGLKDTVELSGEIHLTNQLVDGVDPNSNFNFTNGYGTYTFTCGSPNLTTISGSPDISYTKDIQIAVVPDGAPTVNWLPNNIITPSNANYHAYIIGQRLTGTGVATMGPEKVDFILRDPPGSGSSASWESSNSVAIETSIKTNFSSGTGIETNILLGHREIDGLGIAIESQADNNITLGLDVNTSFDRERSMVETISSTYDVSTRDDAGNVGAPADIFIGRSRNWLMGPTGNIEMIDVAKCNGRCFGPIVNGKQLANTVGFAIAPNGIRTRFAYTQSEIEQEVIPSLIVLRNSILVNRPEYTIIAAPTHSLFGSNNDDPLWGAVASSTNAEVYDPADTTGQSYIFRGYKKGKSDTVRLLNSQIALWKRALAQNEKEKYLAKFSTNTPTVIINPNYVNNPLTEPPTLTIYPPVFQDNFTLGSAIINNSYQVDDEDTKSETYEVAVEQSLTTTLGIKIAGAGFEASPHVSFSEGIETSKSTANSSSNAIAYTLTDGDPGDIMSVDVYRYGLSNIFITRGGQTMCPYEDAVVCHYFDPTHPDAFIGSHDYNDGGYYTLSNATVQREIPNIVITPAIQYNIPSNQKAVYQLVLSNQSPLTVNNDLDLQVRIDALSNPNGAICKIDGQNANNVFTIPSGGSIVKTLTIERGAIEIDYDSLMVIFSSACSSDIADTAYVSVHFIPTCTDLSINSPVDQFVINNNNNELVNITIDDYDYNYGVAANSNTLTSNAHPNYGFEKIGFEFKPANSSQWLQVQEFYKYPNAVGSNTLYPILQGQIYTQYQWTVTTQAYADGNYEIRAVSYCYNKDGSYAKVYSPVHSGVMDRVNPHPFGTPSPGDGILDPNDDISIQFNEQIDISSLSYAPASNPNANFDIRGVLNGTNIRHSESLNFDGISNYVEVSGGVNLQKRPFTIEFWAKLNATGINQTIISQGTDLIQRMAIGFDNSNKLVFSLGNQSVSSNNPVNLPSDWHHYAIVFDYSNTDAMMYVDGVLSGTNNNFVIDYMGSGKLVFGKTIPANNQFFNGNIHDVRLWNDIRTVSEITSTMNKVLTRNQSGLVYNWRMDEADGAVATDVIRSRNADIYGATWEVNPNGNAAQFDGLDDNIQITSGNVPITKEMDFTLEFWFNSSQSGIATLFSNGKGDGVGADSLDAWNIEKDATGIIHVRHNGLDFVATNSNFFDSKWHHFALVMNRTANLSCYVDGNLQNSVQGISFNNLSGANMYLGARGYQTGTVTNYDNYFSGKIDEFRLWNTARKQEQIKRDKQHRMLGDEHGLISFMPFESYALVLGTPSLTPTFNDQSQSTLTVTAQNGAQLISQTPTIKLPRPIQVVNYNYSLNNDKIILTTTTAPELIENVTLDITVKNAYDMRGNKMQSPKTWIAYINKNQVKWQDNQFDFEKTVDSVITFVVPIVNSGGAQKAFTISGIPSWMTSSITNGNIAPNSIQNITFTISSGQNVGDYTAEIAVTTDFNYDESLQINLKVKGKTPNWTVNTASFQYQMNVFGQIKIDNVISTNPDTKVAAFCNGQVRGVANLQYVQAYDKYFAFLNIYSNYSNGDSIYFKIYDGSTGLTYVTVDSSLIFIDNNIVGTLTSPKIFSANTEILKQIPLNAGWTWVSLPLKSNRMTTSNKLMANLHPVNGDVIRSLSEFDQYDSSIGWIGNITSTGGYKNNLSYKIKLSLADTLDHIGVKIHPDSTIAKINIVPGWNWIGFISSRNLLLSEALGNYNAQTGDVIKSQYEFAYYDNLIGWTGSLTHMEPGLGYMLKTTTSSSFNYPLSSYAGMRTFNNIELITVQSIFPFKPEQYRNTMSVIIEGNICNEALESNKIVIGAFDNNNSLRGFVRPLKNSHTNKYNFYLTIYSDVSAETLTLKYFNIEDGSIIASTTTINFESDKVEGSPSRPIIANVNIDEACNLINNSTSSDQLNTINVNVYPNPFNENLTLNFNKEVNCKIELVDVLGKVLFTSQIKNRKTINLLANKQTLASGMYYLRLSGDINQQIKIIKD